MIFIGVWFAWPAPTTESSWNTSRIYRATSQSGSFSLLVSQTLSLSAPDTTYYDESGTGTHWYKYSFYNSSSTVESPLSDAIPATRTTVTYCQPQDVAELLQFRNSQELHMFDSQTKPNIFEVLTYIRRAEDYIDNKTGHAWRARYSGTPGNDATAAEWEHLDQHIPYKKGQGYPLYMKHRMVRTLAAGSGDAVSVWNGSSYTDYLASKTEGRNNDFWVDYERGILYLIDASFVSLDDAVRIKYRYGDSTVPADIEHAATLLAAIHVLEGDERSTVFPEGSFRSAIGEKIYDLKKQAEEIIRAHTETQ